MTLSREAATDSLTNSVLFRLVLLDSRRLAFALWGIACILSIQAIGSLCAFGEAKEHFFSVAHRFAFERADPRTGYTIYSMLVS